MPIYKMRDSFRVRVWVRGQLFDRIAHSKPDAQRLEAEMRTEHGADQPKARGRAVPTFSLLCRNSYAPHAKQALGAQTWSVRRYRIATLCEALGDIRVDRLTSHDVLAYVNARRATVKGSTIADDLKILKAILAFGRRVERLPIPKIEMPAVRVAQKSAREKAKAWTDAEVNRLLSSCRKVSKHVADLILFVAETGVRKTEAIRLRWAGVDLDKAVAWVEPVDGEDDVDWTPKTKGSSRAVPLTPVVVAMLRKRPTGSAWVFGTTRKRGGTTGRPLATWPQLAFDRARKHAKLDGGPHTLRHAFASRFLRAGGSLFELGRVLGHSSQRTTEIYAHMVPDHLASVGATMARASVGRGADAAPKSPAGNRTQDRTQGKVRRKTKAP